SALAPRLFLSLILPPPSSSLFPYTTLFRSSLVNPAVLRQRDLLVRAGVDVEDAEDDHERFVLPDRHIEGLVGDRDREDDGILAQPGGGSFGHGNLRRLERRCAEAEDRLAA